MEENFKNSKTKNRNPITLLFSLEHFEYTYFFVENKVSIKPHFIANELCYNDGLIEMLERIRNIKFTNMQSLVDYCHETKKTYLILPFQWINILISKEEFRYLFDINYNKANKQIFGLINIIEYLIENDKEEILTMNGIKCYSSDLRTKLIKSLVNLMGLIDFFSHSEHDMSNIMRKFILSIFNLNWEDANKVIKEANPYKEVI